MGGFIRSKHDPDGKTYPAGVIGIETVLCSFEDGSAVIHILKNHYAPVARS